MAKRHIRLDDSIARSMKDPAYAAAFRTRRMIHEIALAVRSLRESRGISQAHLAGMVGMKQPAIARLETSQLHAPRWDVLERIMGALNRQLQLGIIERDEKAPIVRVMGASHAGKRPTQRAPSRP
jgi:ribosome-binding protein aMBF1 (putative translation factor)